MTTLPSAGFLQLQLRLKDVRQRRKLGQHFLFDEALLERIAGAAGVDHDTLAVEIGPGPGTLTARLAERGAAVLGIELDRRLRPIHRDVFGPLPAIEFEYADALRVDLHELARAAAERHGRERLVLTGNLPFQITSPLLFGQCGPGVPWRRISVMIQREVADRIASPPGCKAYGILSVQLGLWWRLANRIDVAAARFTPPPRVDASLLTLEPLPAEQTPSADEWPWLAAFIDAAFGQRRKMLVNSLAGRWGAFPGKPKFLAVLEALDVALQTRAESLTADMLRRIHAACRAGAGARIDGP